ncbi:hypothetical protein GCM10025869_23530 [Homoserinibacter gongjuensis]|uniref:Uncharacterized protein n=1 Tax=Homoserinibacter gongjuensis TaxID=1162968 RepID=A0ABQ6JX65_9MICO|nr:hypothetical protein GCM10025869_23530 [Homoserinibacter gongjuensis]
MHDRRVGAQLGETARRLESQQAAARDHGARCAPEHRRKQGDLGGEVVDIRDRAIDASVLGAGDLGNGCTRSGREHDVVVVEHAPRIRRHRARDAVEGDRAFPAQQRDALVLPDRGVEGEVVTADEALAERHPVVRQLLLLADHPEPDAARGIACADRVGQAVRRRPRPDHDDAAWCVLVGHAASRRARQ